MQDPSHGVAQQLQNHVHLISGHRFPLLPRLDIEQAFRYLIDAPTIVKQTAPMAWNYVSQPQVGTMWLEWIASRGGEYRFPSDGYVWGDPEQTYRHDFGGYTIEFMVHNVGFRPTMDQMASQARTRYHFMSKNPSVNAAPPDPSLWIVHYHQTDHNRMIPVSQLQITSPMRQLLTERRWLESQGRLERKDFMLHDREHWPTISVPGTAHMPHVQQPGAYANPMVQQQMNQQRFPQYPYLQGQGQGPPAKRPRHSGPALPGSSDGVQDTSIEDEENTSLGDFFDHLSPREISMARYMQHHRWMEEVFSSPYASSQIVPPDLGLGLMGELKGLTDGILEPPSGDDVGKSLERPSKAIETQPFTNLRKDHLDEFNRRVEKHLEDGQAEIERMKREHAEKMTEWKKTKTVMQAEKRLRFATWDGHESALPLYRLDMPAADGHVEEGMHPATVEAIVNDVQKVLGVKIKGHKDATMIAKGGLEKDEEPPREEVAQDGGMQLDREVSGIQKHESLMSGAHGNAPQAQPGYRRRPSQVSDAKAQALEPSNVPQFTFHGGEQQHAQAQLAMDAQQPVPDDVVEHHHLDDVGGMDMGDHSFIEGMDDMDVDTGDIEFIEHDEASGDEGADPTNISERSAELFGAPDVQTQELQAPDPSTTVNPSVPHIGSPVAFGIVGEQQALTPQQPQQPSLPIANAGNAIDNEATLETSTMPHDSVLADIGEHDPGMGEPGHQGLFDDGTFDDLTNMDDGAGDHGLLDFDAGYGDESAFGDALHGMDTSTPNAHDAGVAGSGGGQTGF